MVHFAPPTKLGLALVPKMDRDLLLSGGAQDHDGPWYNFLLGIDHTIAVAIEGICTPVVLVLRGLDYCPNTAIALSKVSFCTVASGPDDASTKVTRMPVVWPL